MHAECGMSWHAFGFAFLTSVVAVLPGTAAAQTLSVQDFRPIPGSTSFLSFVDPVGAENSFGAGAMASYASEPYVLRNSQTGREIPVISFLSTTNTQVFGHFGRFSASLDMPGNIAAGGPGVEVPVFFGDLTLRADGLLLDRREHVFGSSFFLEGTLPTGNRGTYVSEERPTAGAGFSAALGRKASAGLSLGIGTGSGSEVGELTWGSRLRWGAGVQVPVLEHVRAVAEAGGFWLLSAPFSAGANPAEMLVAARLGPFGSVSFTLGGGAGVSSGIGVPDYRVLGGLSWNRLIEARKTKLVDPDGDHLGSDRDLCPDQAEDAGGSDDTDGCPDLGWALVRIRAFHVDGSPAGPFRLTRSQVMAAAGAAPTPAPKASATPAPKASATPAPKASATPAPNASATPAPKASATLGSTAEGQLARAFPPGLLLARIEADGSLPLDLRLPLTVGRTYAVSVLLDDRATTDSNDPVVVAAAADEHSDRDADGIPDGRDLCPDQPEDPNLLDDLDGCPDGDLVPTHFVIEDAKGLRVDRAHLAITGGPGAGAWDVVDGAFVRSLPPGTHRVALSVEGLPILETSVLVPDGPGHSVVLAFPSPARGGELDLVVHDGDGHPQAAQMALSGPLDLGETIGPDGLAQDLLPAGSYELRLSAAGFATKKMRFDVVARKVVHEAVVLRPVEAPASLRPPGSMPVIARLSFESGSRNASSHPALEDLADLLRARSDLVVVDLVGMASGEIDRPCDARAGAEVAGWVRDRLVEAGVEPERLRAIGVAHPPSDEAAEARPAGTATVLARVRVRSEPPTVSSSCEGIRPAN
jgi:hypothetical protein